MIRTTLAILLCLGLVLAGCGGTQSDSTTPDEEAADNDGENSETEGDEVDEETSTDPETTEEVIETSRPLG